MTTATTTDLQTQYDSCRQRFASAAAALRTIAAEANGIEEAAASAGLALHGGGVCTGPHRVLSAWCSKRA